MTDAWTQLVQRVDRLIAELRASRVEAKRWQTRATELERLHLKDDRTSRMEEQAKDRELERLRREHKKTVSVVTRLIGELDQVMERIREQSANE